VKVVHEPEAFRAACDSARLDGRRVGLVPTMGALHEGHLSLVEEAKKRADLVAVSIFVNPTQFGPGEDLDAYPRTLDADAEKCRERGVSLVFAPEANAMYPPGEETRVNVGRTAADLCGASRPGHFEGVATVVTKLLSLTGSCVAVFGRKDYQQLRVIQRLVTDLFLPVEVVGAPIVREPDGLALSSRNTYLSAEDRRRALALSRSLSAAVHAFARGERDAARLIATVHQILDPSVDAIDYITIAHPETVVPIEGDVGDRALLAIAARVGGTRLIDNVVLGTDDPPTPTQSTP
jgi:pantoate--beta-alanine ligase